MPPTKQKSDTGRADRNERRAVDTKSASNRRQPRPIPTLTLQPRRRGGYPPPAKAAHAPPRTQAHGTCSQHSLGREHALNLARFDGVWVGLVVGLQQAEEEGSAEEREAASAWRVGGWVGGWVSWEWVGKAGVMGGW